MEDFNEALATLGGHRVIAKDIKTSRSLQSFSLMNVGLTRVGTPVTSWSQVDVNESMPRVSPMWVRETY